MDRIETILRAPEAQGRNKALAEHLAYKTALTPTEAIAAMRATAAGRQAQIDAAWADSVAKVNAQHPHLRAPAGVARH